MMWKEFLEITNVLKCGMRSIFVVVACNRPYCWTCGAVGHLSKLCPGRKPALAPATSEAPKPAATEETVVVEKLGQDPNNWREAMRKGKKPATFSTQQDVPPKKVVLPKLQREQQLKLQREQPVEEQQVRRQRQ